MAGVFLHDPISPIEVEEAVTSARKENVALDFKREFWVSAQRNEAQEEAGKDVAAMANARGGDIVVGVTDKQGSASGFFPDPKAHGRTVQLRRWLRNRLVPAELAELIQIREAVAGNTPILIVSVPAWDSSAVSVRIGREARPVYLFPLRSDDQTEYLSLGDVMNRLSRTTRRTWVRLESLRSEGRSLVRFSSPVGASIEGGFGPLGLRDERHATIDKLDSHTLDLWMAGGSISRWIPVELPPGNRSEVNQAVTIPDRTLFRMPLELINACWAGYGGRDIEIAARGRVIYDPSLRVWRILTEP